MKANLKMIQKEPRLKHKKYILATRISYWSLGEESKVRKEFRNWLTKRIQDGFMVKRIWQIQSVEEFERMLIYLDLYKEYDNYYLKCFIGKNTLIPEFLSNSGLSVSISIPQSDNPRRMVATFQYLGKKEISFWEDYFNLIWDRSIVIKIGSEIYYDKISEIKDNLTKEFNEKPSMAENFL